MRVALDAEPLALTSGGLKRYVEELTQALRLGYPEDEYLFLPEPKNFIERRWWLYGAESAAQTAQADVYHGTNFAIPFFSRRPTVLTLHDLSPWHNPKWHNSRAATRIRRRTPYLLPRASHIITPSQAVRSEAISRFRIDPARITAIPLAASAHFCPTPFQSNPYFLFVGTQEPRKGLHTLLAAWRATGSTIPLRLAGRRREDFPPLPPEPNLHILGEVPDADLPALYTNARAVIYPSEYEGFGLPVLEAMQCGANIITSQDPALRELTADTGDHFASIRELRELLQNHSARPWPVPPNKASIARASQYSWQQTAARTHQVYAAVLRK